MQAFLGEAARRRQSRRSSTSSKGTSGPSVFSAKTNSHERTKSSSSARLFRTNSKPTKRNTVPKKASNKSLSAEQASPPSSSHHGSPNDKESVDVFAFMEHDEEDKASSNAIEEEEDQHEETHSLQGPSSPVAASHTSHEAPEHRASVGYSDLEVHGVNPHEGYDHHDAHLQWTKDRARSETFNSDSGISVHSSSNGSGNDSPVLSHKVAASSHTSEEQDDHIQSMPKLRLGHDTFPFPNHHARRASAARLRRFPAATAQSQDLYTNRPESYYEPTSDVIPEIETHSPQSLSSAQVQDLPQVSAAFSAPSPALVGISQELPSPPPPRKHLASAISSAKPSPSCYSTPSPTVLPRKPQQHPPSGYSLLASSLSTTTHPTSDAVLRPIYRKFETLNNRILLYLQDEISEMEQDLKDLDDAIANEEYEERMYNSRMSSAGLMGCTESGMPIGLPQHPSVAPPGKLGKCAERGIRKRRESRRQEAKFPSQLQWVRQELMGRLGGKVAQYNRALSSYSTLTQSLAPASTTDISAYKTWISKHNPVADPEVSFILDDIHHPDLCTFPSPPTTSSSSNPSSSISSSHPPTTTIPHSPTTPSSSSFSSQHILTPYILTLFTLISTTILFKFLPNNFLPRLIVAMAIALASYSSMSSRTRRRVRGRDGKGWKRAVGGYLGVVGVLALVVE